MIDSVPDTNRLAPAGINDKTAIKLLEHPPEKLNSFSLLRNPVLNNIYSSIDPLTMAPKLLTLVRHGQAFHNVEQRYHLRDTYLTPLGEEQCRGLPSRFPPEPAVDLLVSSPLKRTLQTTLIGFSPQVKKGIKVEILPELQESSAMPCDTGSTREELEAEEKFAGMDFSRCIEGWNSKEGKWATNALALEERARVARNWLKGRNEDHVVAVLHGGFLHHLTEDWSDDGTFHGTGWNNTEFRSYTFVEEEGDNATIVETEASKARRVEHPPGKTEQKEFEQVAN